MRTRNGSASRRAVGGGGVRGFPGGKGGEDLGGGVGAVEARGIRIQAGLAQLAQLGQALLLLIAEIRVPDMQQESSSIVLSLTATPTGARPAGGRRATAGP